MTPVGLHSPPVPNTQRVAPATTVRRALWRRPLAACALLFVVYLALSFLNDPRGSLGTDSGGKLATLAAMEESGRAVPDVGYWAAAADPRGVLHPLYYTERVGDHWVNVTTLPMLYAGRPLYRIGGERALLALPMLGAVLCALAARRVARLLGGDGMAAFWAVGLATPVAVYALDFWEHTLGLACMLFGVAILVELARGATGAGAALGAGALFGFAATMRTEALVYLAVGTAVALASLLVRRTYLARVVALGAAIGAGASAVLVANQLVERLVLGAGFRAGRAAGTAGAAGTGLAGRVGEAFTTTFGLNGLRPPVDVIAGGAVVALVAVAVLALGFRAEPNRVVGVGALAVATVVFVARFGDGLGFVPGFLVASPLAVAGLCFGWRVRRASNVLLVAVSSLPLVWLLQYQGGARPQWGGRYVLCSGALLAVAGVVVLRRRRAAFVATVAFSLLVTAFGVAWLSERSHSVAYGMERVLARHDDAVISTDAHLFREGGAFYEPGRHWLTAVTATDLRRAAAVVSNAGDREVAVIAREGDGLPRRLGDFVRGPAERLRVLPGQPLVVRTYRR
jgi:hypothetical protein